MSSDPKLPPLPRTASEANLELRRRETPRQDRRAELNAGLARSEADALRQSSHKLEFRQNDLVDALKARDQDLTDHIRLLEAGIVTLARVHRVDHLLPPDLVARFSKPPPDPISWPPKKPEPPRPPVLAVVEKNQRQARSVSLVTLAAIFAQCLLVALLIALKILGGM